MCVILGIEQNWWSITGLGFDVIGFIFLSKDLMSDIKISTSVAQIDALKRLNTDLNEEYRELGGLPEDRSRNLADKFFRELGDEPDFPDNTPEVRHLRYRFKRIKPAIGAIIFGFILQIVGTWPC